MKKPSAAFVVIIIAIAILFGISSSPVSPQEQQNSLSTLIREGSTLIDKGDSERAATLLVQAYMRAERKAESLKWLYVRASWAGLFTSEKS
jgi:outer membrane protein assembly factor BamD (BamD/ComL family)